MFKKSIFRFKVTFTELALKAGISVLFIVMLDEKGFAFEKFPCRCSKSSFIHVSLIVL